MIARKDLTTLDCSFEKANAESDGSQAVRRGRVDWHRQSRRRRNADDHQQKRRLEGEQAVEQSEVQRTREVRGRIGSFPGQAQAGAEEKVMSGIHREFVA